MITKIYETERLYVRPFVEKDLGGNYRNWWYDPEVTRHNSHGLFPYTESQMRTFLSRLASSSDIVWAVVAKVNKEGGISCPPPGYENHIGNVALQNINWVNRTAEFACVFGEKEFWNQGFCTEAAVLLFDHGFNRLNLNRIWTGTAVSNRGMRRVAGKLGMIREGEFRDAMFLNGQYVNVVEFGILAEEMFI